MSDAAEIVQHYRAKGFAHFELRRRLIRHARMLRTLDPVAAAELIKRSRRTQGGRAR